MLIQLDPLIWSISFYATIAVIVAKFSIAAFIGRRVALQSKNQAKRRLTFLGAAFLLILCLGISRLIYFYYDFFLTNFNPDLLWRTPQVYYWQAATCIGGYSGAFLLFVLERDIYRFKTCLIPTGLIVAVATFQLLYPIDSVDAFKLVSTVGLLGTFASVIAVITFIYIAIKSPGLMRRVCIALVFGLVLFALAGMVMSENLLATLDAAFPGMRTIIIVAVPIVKIVSLVIIAWGAVHFQL
ncbi:MAG: hypothetical protein Q6373_015830 [Candidatus Sigynarchaeota archaeon]